MITKTNLKINSIHLLSLWNLFELYFWWQNAIDELREVEADLDELEGLRLELAAYFCEDETKFRLDDCIKTFNTFCECFQRTIQVHVIWYTHIDILETAINTVQIVIKIKPNDKTRSSDHLCLLSSAPHIQASILWSFLIHSSSHLWNSLHIFLKTPNFTYHIHPVSNSSSIHFNLFAAINSQPIPLWPTTPLFLTLLP